MKRWNVIVTEDVRTDLDNFVYYLEVSRNANRRVRFQSSGKPGFGSALLFFIFHRKEQESPFSASNCFNI